jgi:riboflavin kinase/FMN adenylyltransferase
MYLIRGKHNLDLFRKFHPEVSMHGTIGNFDGIHKGHQSILSKIKNRAKETNSASIVFFTEPHASEYFAISKNTDISAPPRIYPWRKKFELLKEFGIDFVFFLKFNNSLRKMTPEIFISDILDSVGLISLTVGDDFRFGANRAGGFELLKEWGHKKNIEVANTETFEYLNERVSSTRIREALLENNFSLAQDLLGRPYIFSGKVVHGQHL